MRPCKLYDADIVIDQKPYRFDSLADYKRFCNLRLKGITLINPPRSEARLKLEAKEMKTEMDKG